MRDSVKILIMVVVSIIATTISTAGIPATTGQWIVLGLTVLGTVLTYVAKNWIIPSSSVLGALNWMDIISGIVLLAGTTVSNFVAEMVIGSVIDWQSLWKTLLVVLAGYLAKTIFQIPASVKQIKE